MRVTAIAAGTTVASSFSQRPRDDRPRQPFTKRPLTGATLSAIGECCPASTSAPRVDQPPRVRREPAGVGSSLHLLDRQRRGVEEEDRLVLGPPRRNEHPPHAVTDGAVRNGRRIR